MRRWPMMTTRRWMVTIPVLAPIFAVAPLVFDELRSLDDFYGPFGLQDTEQKLHAEVEVGTDLMR